MSVIRFVSSGVCKKPSLAEAEDLVSGANGFYWLLDGATPPKASGGHEVTRAYVESLSAALVEESNMAPSPWELLEVALGKIPNFEEVQPSSTVVLVQVCEDRIRYSVLGDSFLSILLDGEELVVTDDRLKKVATDERERVRALRERGVLEDSEEYVKARATLIDAERKCRNVRGGYWIAANAPMAAREARNGEVSLVGKKQVQILAVSDGLERMVSAFGEFSSLAKMGDVLARGAEQVFERLREMEQKPSRFSSKHDDASYFLLSGEV